MYSCSCAKSGNEITTTKINIFMYSYIYIYMNCCHDVVEQIPQCTCPISHNAPFGTEMCTCLFWMLCCGIWQRCIVGFFRWIHSNILINIFNHNYHCGFVVSTSHPNRVILIISAMRKCFALSYPRDKKCPFFREIYLPTAGAYYITG